METSTKHRKDYLPDLGLYIATKENFTKNHSLKNIFCTHLVLIDTDTYSFNTNYCYDDKEFLLTIDISTEKLSKLLVELANNEPDFFDVLMAQFNQIPNGLRKIDFTDKTLIFNSQLKLGNLESSKASEENFIPFVLDEIEWYRLIDRIVMDY